MVGFLPTGAMFGTVIDQMLGAVSAREQAVIAPRAPPAVAEAWSSYRAASQSARRGARRDAAARQAAPLAYSFCRILQNARRPCSRALWLPSSSAKNACGPSPSMPTRPPARAAAGVPLTVLLCIPNSAEFCTMHACAALMSASLSLVASGVASTAHGAPRERERGEGHHHDLQRPGLPRRVDAVLRARACVCLRHGHMRVRTPRAAGGSGASCGACWRGGSSGGGGGRVGNLAVGLSHGCVRRSGALRACAHSAESSVRTVPFCQRVGV